MTLTDRRRRLARDVMALAEEARRIAAAAVDAGTAQEAERLGEVAQELRSTARKASAGDGPRVALQ